MNILNPPKSYVDYRCYTHDWEMEDDPPKGELEQVRSKFYKQFPGAKEEVKRFCSWLHDARHDETLPIEKIEVRESDYKKHGQVVSMMIFDIQYWRDEGRIKMRKIYVPLEKVLYQHIPPAPSKEIEATLFGKQAEEFEKKRQAAKARLPFSGKDDVPF
jgi:hypothetical protein